jgi:transcriptional regulator with XRE-family HTH domain
MRRKHHDPRLHADGMITKESLAHALLDLRKHRGLRPTDVARRASSTPDIISRLESVHGRLPDLDTLARYGLACGVDVGLLFATPIDGQLTVHSAVTLQSAEHRKLYESLLGEKITLPTPHESGSTQDASGEDVDA